MKEQNTKLFNLVTMNDANISTLDKPIIGTQAMATCFGILLYERKKKIALVAHVSSDFYSTLSKLFSFIDLSSPNTFEYLIIAGYDSEKEDHYNVYKQLLEILNNCDVQNAKFIPFKDKNLKNIVNLDTATLSYEFAFDSRTGKFVNDEVYFGFDYLEINKSMKTKK